MGMATSSPSCGPADGTSPAARSHASAVRAARDRHGLELQVIGFDDFRIPGGSYDAIGAYHVLEHLYEPRAVLRGIRDALSPGGVLHLQLPNIGSIDGRIGRQSWWGLRCPQHVTFYEPRHLRRLLPRRASGSSRSRPTTRGTARQRWSSPCAPWRDERIGGRSARSAGRAHPRPRVLCPPPLDRACRASCPACRRWPGSSRKPRHGWARATSPTSSRCADDDRVDVLAWQERAGHRGRRLRGLLAGECPRRSRRGGHGNSPRRAAAHELRTIGPGSTSECRTRLDRRRSGRRARRQRIRGGHRLPPRGSGDRRGGQSVTRVDLRIERARDVDHSRSVSHRSARRAGGRGVERQGLRLPAKAPVHGGHGASRE